MDQKISTARVKSLAGFKPSEDRRDEVIERVTRTIERLCLLSVWEVFWKDPGMRKRILDAGSRCAAGRVIMESNDDEGGRIMRYAGGEALMDEGISELAPYLTPADKLLYILACELPLSELQSRD